MEHFFIDIIEHTYFWYRHQVFFLPSKLIEFMQVLAPVAVSLILEHMTFDLFAFSLNLTLYKNLFENYTKLI